MFLVFFGVVKAGVVDLEEPHLTVLETPKDVLAGAVRGLAQKEVSEGHEVHPLRQGKVTALWRSEKTGGHSGFRSVRGSKGVLLHWL